MDQEKIKPYGEVISPQSDISTARRLGRRILRVFRRRKIAPEEELSPHAVIAPDEMGVEQELGLQQSSTEEPAPLGMRQDRTVVVTLVDELHRFEFNSEDNEALYPHATLHHQSAGRLHNRLARMYLSAEAGEHSSQAIADLLGLKETTVLNDARQLEATLPKEIFNFAEIAAGGLRLWLGNLSLAARRPNERDIAELDKGKTDLTISDHAIITKGANRYYVPFDSNESILAVRVVEALQDFNKIGANTDNIAQAVWQHMTVAERRLFLDDPAYAFGHAEQVHDEVLDILRKLTNRLMLTLEPIGQKFTVYSEDLTVEFHDGPIDIHDYSDARPVSPPGQEIIVELSPTHLDTAREVLQAVREGRRLEDAEAIRMLDFITSVSGRRAIAEVFEPMEGIRTATKAVKAIHALLKLNLGEAYTTARRNRTVSGNRIIRSRGAVRQVSGRLPTTTKWHIGRPLGETFEK